MKGENTFVTFLNLLGVKHTAEFSNKYFNEHPHKNNLYGLSKMLSDYGVQNAATRIEDKENDLFNIECPFVVHAGGAFSVVCKINSDEIHYLWNSKKIILPVSRFIQIWSGIILLAETSPDSCEPDYREHRKKDLLALAQQSILALAGILIVGLAYINNSCLYPVSSAFPYINWGITLLLLVNFVGIYICYLLVLKQLNIHSRYSDKICTLFSQSDCNNVLESDAAKLWGIFGWSEIGLGYFVANSVILLFLPHLIHYLVLVNIMALPYTVWSVWYQKVKAHQWCPLCLIVQVLLWIIFILNGLFGYIILPVFDIQDILITGCLYVVPVFTLNLLLHKLNESNQVENLRQEINSIKSNEEVFSTMLTQQPFYEVSKFDSQILFGNPDSKLKISIFTNPFCNPCAKMHVRVEKLLKETKESVSIQYIFSSFNKDIEYANLYFNAIYLEKSVVAAMQIFTDWFTGGKKSKERFFENLQLDMNNPAIKMEFQRHEAWKQKTQLRATPTILVNGYKLPENYKIEDLCYFTEFDVIIK